MSTIEQLMARLDTLGVLYRPIDDETVACGFTGDHTAYEVQLTADGPLVSLLARPAALVPATRLAPALGLVNLINATRLRWGAFWISPESRRLVFELAIVTPEEGGPSCSLLALALGAVPVDQYFPAFAKVLWAGFDAEQALEGGETPTEADAPGGDGQPDGGGMELAV